MHLLLAQTAVGLSAGGIIHLLVIVLIAALIIGLIYWIAITAFPAAANIIKVVCLVSFLIVILLLLLPLLGV